MPYRFRPLHVYFQDNVLAGLKAFPHLAAGDAVPTSVNLSALKKLVSLSHFVEGVGVQEEVVLSVSLPRSRRACGGSNRKMPGLGQLSNLGQNGILAHARRPANHYQKRSCRGEFRYVVSKLLGQLPHLNSLPCPSAGFHLGSRGTASAARPAACAP